MGRSQKSFEAPDRKAWIALKGLLVKGGGGVNWMTSLRSQTEMKNTGKTKLSLYSHAS